MSLMVLLRTCFPVTILLHRSTSHPGSNCLSFNESSAAPALRSVPAEKAQVAQVAHLRLCLKMLAAYMVLVLQLGDLKHNLDTAPA